MMIGVGKCVMDGLLPTRTRQMLFTIQLPFYFREAEVINTVMGYCSGFENVTSDGIRQVRREMGDDVCCS